jgi:uncharacterized RDD family membrane protein YckC
MPKAKKNLQLASFGIRLVAILIDSVLLGIGLSIVRSPFRWGFSHHRFGFPGWSPLINALYSILLWVGWNGQTIGKKIMKIKVVREDGKPLDYPTAIIRYIGYIISTIPLFLGYLWVIWDDKKQGFHDKLARTLVVKE